MWKLVIEDDEGKRTVVPLTRDEYTIGRKEGNTIRLTERNVSREHASSSESRTATPAPRREARAGFVLEDLTSYNGVFVNGLRITQAQDLAHGDLIQIGDYRIVLQDERSPTSRPRSPGPTTRRRRCREAPSARGARAARSAQPPRHARRADAGRRVPARPRSG